MSEPEQDNVVPMAAQGSGSVGYCRPPVHSRFKPGQSGNPSGRAKGSKNLKTLIRKVLNEEMAVRDGATIKRITKAEAIIRGLVISALKGDSRSVATLFKVAEETGQLDEAPPAITAIRRIIIEPRYPAGSDPGHGLGEDRGRET